METVGNYPDLASARIAQSLLEAEGIESVIPDEFLAGVDWQMGTAIHGVRLQVEPDDAEEARSLLAQSVVAESEAPDDDLKCPRCGSADVAQRRWKHRLKAATLFMPLLLVLWPVIAFVRPAWQCSACGHRWKRAA